MEKKTQITVRLDTLVLAKALWRLIQLTGRTPVSLSQIVKLAMLRFAQEAEQSYGNKPTPDLFKDYSKAETFIQSTLSLDQELTTIPEEKNALF